MINGVGKRQQQSSATKIWSHISDLFLILIPFFLIKYWIMLLRWTLSSYFSQTIYMKSLMKLPTKTSEMQQEAQNK